MPRCGTLTWVRDTRTTTRVASVPNRKREHDLLSVGNVKRWHPWHWCVVGRQVPQGWRNAAEQLQQGTECWQRVGVRKLTVNFFQKSPRTLRRHHLRIWIMHQVLCHYTSGALWNLLPLWTHLYSQLVRPGEADLCLQKALHVMGMTE